MWPCLLHAGVPGLRIEGIVQCVALACIRLVYEVLTVPGRRWLLSNLELCSGLHFGVPVEAP